LEPVVCRLERMKAKWLSMILVGAAAALGGAYRFNDDFRALADRFFAARPDGENKAAPDFGSAGPTRSGRAPAPVIGATAVVSDMPVVLYAPGTVEPLATVAIKSRVDGQIVEVAFEEGDLVRAGQVLFRLDDRWMIAQIRQAEANIAKDRATLAAAEAQLRRREHLVGKQIVSEEATETVRQSVAAHKAAIAAGQAQLEAQRTQLDYLTIRAPITGRTGNVNAKLGATVRASDTTPLVTINQTQPIAVAFAVPQSELDALRRALAAKSSAVITIPGAVPPHRLRGTIGFVDNQVDKQTGTVLAKVTAANEDEALWPGQAVEIALTVEVKSRIVAVPASAVLPAQQGMLVWVIDRENKVAPRTVVVDRIVGQTAFLGEGLVAGERVVTEGQLRLAPGAPVVVREPPVAPVPSAEGVHQPSGRS
jgi:multidrug efflux system membrane fusion protein